MRREEYWLISTAHLEKQLLFKETEDFVVGMNYVAVQAYKCRVGVLSFVLMSNHLHLVANCGRDAAVAFADGFKREYARYLNKKYGDVEALRRNDVDIREASVYDEGLERAIAYVQMNSVAANICATPFDYPWGTGGSFFGTESVMAGSVTGRGDDLLDCESVRGVPPMIPGGRRLGEMSARERYRVLHSKADVPPEWIVCERGYIIPSSYVKVNLVERVFRTPGRFNYFLRTSSKAKLKLEMGDDCLPSFSDQVILAAVPELCRSLFKRGGVEGLNEDQMVELLRQLKYRFSSNAKQLARVTKISYKAAEALLDRV